MFHRRTKFFLYSHIFTLFTKAHTLHQLDARMKDPRLRNQIETDQSAEKLHNSAGDDRVFTQHEKPNEPNLLPPVFQCGYAPWHLPGRTKFGATSITTLLEDFLTTKSPQFFD